MSLQFQRVSKKNPCPICGKFDFCEIGDRAVLCQRIESDHPNKRDAGGWFHHFGAKNAASVPLRVNAPPRKTVELKNPEQFLESWTNGTSNRQLGQLADELAVSANWLTDLGACYSTYHKAWAFPMRDGQGNTIGIRLRSDIGKWAVKGSRSGIFLAQSPEAFELIDRNGMAFVCEGPTDCAAALTLGFFAIGKPSCNSGDDYVIETLQRLKIYKSVLVTDNDSLKVGGHRPGLESALKLQSKLKIRSCLWMPPSPIKDLREFVRKGGTRELIESDLNKKVWMKK